MLEAKGGYEREAVAVTASRRSDCEAVGGGATRGAAAGLPVVVVNPRQARDLVVRRRQKLDIRKADNPPGPRPQRDRARGAASHIAWLTAEIAQADDDADDDLDQAIRDMPAPKADADPLISTPGVGSGRWASALARTLIAELPEPGCLNRRQVAALVACMRRLVVTLNAILKARQPWTASTAA